MVISYLKGGLGNQFFQYATGYALSRELNCPLYLDTSHYKNKQQIRKFELSLYQIESKEIGNTQKLILKVLSKISPEKNIHIQEKQFHFVPFDLTTLSSKKSVWLDGYWQSPLYFEKYRADILRQFQLSQSPSPENQSLLSEIRNSNSIFLHVRRGDYVSNKSAASFHGTLPISYYEHALQKLNFTESSNQLFIFTDDPEWCIESFKTINSKRVVTHNQNSGWEDLRLMSECKAGILANSTFSWWGAWLNQNSNLKIIAPKNWFTDGTIRTCSLTPSSWSLI